MITQEDEHRQIMIDGQISKVFHQLYDLLNQSDRIEAEEALGHVAEAKAIWEGDIGSFSNREDFE